MWYQLHDGDGIHSTNPDNSSAYFDFNGSGSRTNTGWISAGDGFLVLDRNPNGTIDSGAELFSNFTPRTAMTRSGRRAGNDAIDEASDLYGNDTDVVELNVVSAYICISKADLVLIAAC
ncbi:hypothetical protein AYM40_06445 [Paraburkholderia phytofirmans OLGA172]|uniref:Uncharacterized protein n=1 Tax=Paraburkholderia phytofirmans OLGA172 TaxID=1417228 RepID=A0A160FJE3_9BURK|nr:hypothetical protein [Paraburkholderia phytofirmans]ANB72048.1 hypothetical protein AYM40_06445 [Paraburkholderia phytofirmans OLGA172]